MRKNLKNTDLKHTAQLLFICIYMKYIIYILLYIICIITCIYNIHSFPHNHHPDWIQATSSTQKLPSVLSQSVFLPAPKPWKPLLWVLCMVPCKWNHTIYTLLSLVSSTSHNVYEILPCYCFITSLFLFIDVYYSCVIFYDFLECYMQIF